MMPKAKVDTILFNLKNFKKMQTKKMSLANIQGKLGRAEMKNIIAGGCGLSNCKCYSPGSYCPSGQIATYACPYGGGAGFPGTNNNGITCCNFY